MKQYAVTARKTNKPITEQHYQDYLRSISGKGEIGNVNYENKRGLHVHFVIESDSIINFNTLRPTKRGWMVKVVPIYNMKGWISYINKPHDEKYDVTFHKDEFDMTKLTKSLFT